MQFSVLLFLEKNLFYFIETNLFSLLFISSLYNIDKQAYRNYIWEARKAGQNYKRYLVILAW